MRWGRAGPQGPADNAKVFGFYSESRGNLRKGCKSGNEGIWFVPPYSHLLESFCVRTSHLVLLLRCSHRFRVEPGVSNTLAADASPVCPKTTLVSSKKQFEKQIQFLPSSDFVKWMRCKTQLALPADYFKENAWSWGSKLIQGGFYVWRVDS